MILLQADEGVAVFRPDRSGILVGHIDAAVRQPDVVDDVVELLRRDGPADDLLDEIELTRRLLDARAGLGAHMHQDLPGIHGGEKVLAQEREQAEGEQYADEKSGDESFRSTEGERQ